MFDFLATASQITNPKDALTRANFAVQDKLGKFMSSGSRILALRDKTSNPLLIAKANELLHGITDIQTTAFSVMGEAKTLQEKTAGGAFSLADIKSGAEVAKHLFEINAEMDAHMGKVDTLAWEIAGSPKAPVKFLQGVDPRLLLLGGLAAVALFLYMRRRGKK